MVCFLSSRLNDLKFKEMEKQLVAHCRKDLIKWCCPRNIEFRDELPLTLVGKVAYKVLEDEEIETLKKTGQYTGE
ncbi:MAG: hypothetical protein R6X10_10495 [Desulfobacterales bacterium]